MAIIQESDLRRGNRTPVLVRPMAPADIPQVEEIEREAFPTTWPPTSFKRELQNRLARYLVVCLGPQEEPPLAGPVVPPPEKRAPGLLQRLWPFRRQDPVAPGPSAPRPLVAGFEGTWFMADEAHIVSIAVREASRRQGLGELLLIAAIELAMERGSREVTLEVRVSNQAAQALYEKYGFRRAGVRKGYYSDNREDALIMTTDPLDSPSSRGSFQRLKAAYRDRWGEAVCRLS
ncbi:MAG: ribosomal protein S18-alanine N-acetyltransferase [Chloroflexi bacterium]|nr:ribosomal protein S18-alanine N-acetyltransferase [Chloroflexota bacterium]